MKPKTSLVPAVCGIAALASLATVTAQADESGSSQQRDESNWHLTPSVGFGYRTLAVGDDLDDYVDETRQKFEPAMPGFKDFMKLGEQLPYLTAEVAVSTPWHFLPRDMLRLGANVDYSSSAIFGKTTDKETYDASLSAIQFGATPSTWTQELDWYGALGIGAQYSPIEIGKTFKFRPWVNFSGGISRLDSHSILHIHVNDDPKEVREGLITWEALNSAGVYQDIRTDADSYGTGYFVEPAGGFSVEFHNFSLEALAGYRHEKIPSFIVDEYTVQDGAVETKNTEHEYDASGLDVKVKLGYKF
ncbi:hypothetical protein HZC30_05785 [Candidatus Woesearchaeota archaeon]|nr:hypothetical protein [Candidatus Woesearchaeota archaeon]